MATLPSSLRELGSISEVAAPRSRQTSSSSRRPSRRRRRRTSTHLLQRRSRPPESCARFCDAILRTELRNEGGLAQGGCPRKFCHSSRFAGVPGRRHCPHRAWPLVDSTSSNSAAEDDSEVPSVTLRPLSHPTHTLTACSQSSRSYSSC